MIADFEPNRQSSEKGETIGKLPNPLEFLRLYLEQVTGFGSLAESLKAINAHRILEVGIGSGTRSFLDIMASLVGLKNKQGKNLFSKEDLIACDPDLYSDGFLATEGGVEQSLLNRFTRQKARVVELAAQIVKYPFS